MTFKRVIWLKFRVNWHTILHDVAIRSVLVIRQSFQLHFGFHYFAQWNLLLNFHMGQSWVRDDYRISLKDIDPLKEEERSKHSERFSNVCCQRPKGVYRNRHEFFFYMTQPTKLTTTKVTIKKQNLSYSLLKLARQHCLADCPSFADLISNTTALFAVSYILVDLISNALKHCILLPGFRSVLL